MKNLSKEQLLNLLNETYDDYSDYVESAKVAVSLITPQFCLFNETNTNLQKCDDHNSDADSYFILGCPVKLLISRYLLHLHVSKENQFDLNLPIVNLLSPEFPFTSPHLTEITTRHLLTHTSGIDDVLIRSSDKLKDMQTLYKGLDSSVTLFRPGEYYSYCNTGYILAAMIIEAVAGIDWLSCLNTFYGTNIKYLNGKSVRSDIGARKNNNAMERSGSIERKILNFPRILSPAFGHDIHIRNNDFGKIGRKLLPLNTDKNSESEFDALTKENHFGSAPSQYFTGLGLFKLSNTVAFHSTNDNAKYRTFVMMNTNENYIFTLIANKVVAGDMGIVFKNFLVGTSNNDMYQIPDDNPDSMVGRFEGNAATVEISKTGNRELFISRFLLKTLDHARCDLTNCKIDLVKTRNNSYTVNNYPRNWPFGMPLILFFVSSKTSNTYLFFQKFILKKVDNVAGR